MADKNNDGSSIPSRKSCSGKEDSNMTNNDDDRTGSEAPRKEEASNLPKKSQSISSGKAAKVHGEAKRLQAQQIISSLVKKISSQEFIRFIEQSLVGHSIELNPHLTNPERYKSFVEECAKCAAEGTYSIRIVFQGTPSKNIEAILRDGLDPSLRRFQAFGQGEYFARRPALPVLYCRGGNRMLVFAVLTTKADRKTSDVIVVERIQRQLPIATLSFASIRRTALAAASAFHEQVSKLYQGKEEQERLVVQAKAKEKIISRLLEREYEAASDIYKKACAVRYGKPSLTWMDEIALYVRDHIRDNTFVDILFPGLPQRPRDSATVPMFSLKSYERNAQKAKRAYEEMNRTQDTKIREEMETSSREAKTEPDLTPQPRELTRLPPPAQRGKR